MYSIPEECPSRISDNTKDLLLTDNIFNKARSMDGDILINYDFSFEDIPDGFPLEDPLYYDNLTQKNKEDKNNLTIDNDIEMLGYDDLELYKKYTEETIDRSNKEFLKNSVLKKVNDNTYQMQNRQLNSGKNIENKRDLFEYVNNKPIENEKIRSYNKANTEPIENINKNLTESINVMYNDPVVAEEFKNFTLPQDPKINNSSLKQQNGNLEVQAINSEQGAISKVVDIKDSKHKETVAFVNFHVIDSERDLDVPSGIEGPVPSIVLPPDNFFAKSGKLQPK